MPGPPTRKPNRIETPKKPSTAWFLQVLENNKITPAHVSQILDTVGRIADAKIQAGLMEIETTQRIRELMTALQTDTQRADRARDLFEAFLPHLDDEEKSSLAALIIKVQLGVRN